MRQRSNPLAIASQVLRSGLLAPLAALAAVPSLLAAPALAEPLAGSTLAGAAQYLTLGASAAPAFQTSSSGSALEQITRMQGGAPAALPGPQPLVLASLSASPRFSPEPQPLLQPAVLRSSPSGYTGADPSLFGSVALPVTKTGLQKRWMNVAGAARPAGGRWNEVVRRAAALPDQERLELVNTWVNRAITFESDSSVWGARDYWASARESLARGRGDCEDYAIAKMQMLQAAGVPASSLYLVIVRDLVGRIDHAVLAVRLDDGYWVLDNRSDTVLAAGAVQDYRPVVTYSAGRAWLHGYQRRPALTLASAASLAPSGSR